MNLFSFFNGKLITFANTVFNYFCKMQSLVMSGIGTIHSRHPSGTLLLSSSEQSHVKPIFPRKQNHGLFFPKQMQRAQI